MTVFSEVSTYEWLDDNEFAFVIRAPQPLHPGHVLVVSKREVATWFDATHEERLAILDLIDRIKRMLDASEPRPQGYNVCFDAGEAAGQTVMHLHVNVVPRRIVQAPPPRLVPSYALERARELAAQARSNASLILPAGRRARVLGPAEDGGVRIVGPDTGHVERTISQLDLAWALAAEQEGALDVAGVDRVRGTSSPDTAWAIALLRAAR